MVIFRKHSEERFRPTPEHRQQEIEITSYWFKRAYENAERARRAEAILERYCEQLDRVQPLDRVQAMNGHVVHAPEPQMAMSGAGVAAASTG